MTHAEDGMTHAEGVPVRSRSFQYGRGKELWASLEELAQSPELAEFFEREFPPGAETRPPGMDRRRFLQLMGASLALSGVTGCGRDFGRPEGRGAFAPFARTPEELIPGKPLYYATSFPFEGKAIGVLGETHMGRPTKIEGNPQHPGSLGSTDHYSQASVLDLYDPARARTVTYRGRISGWDAFRDFLVGRREALAARRGAGLRILTGAVTSPSFIALIRAFLEEMPEARWIRYEPVGDARAGEGAVLAFGRPLHALYRLDQADVVASFDADFLAWSAGRVRYSRDWSERRRVRAIPPDGPGMSRLYAVEGLQSLTGAMADHRLCVPPSRVGDVLEALARTLGVLSTGKGRPLSGEEKDWVRGLTADLLAARGRSVVVAGEPQPPHVHALAHAVNAFLGNAGRTVVHTRPLEEGAPGDAAQADRIQSLADLAREMRSGDVDTLLIMQEDPAYAAPADLEFAEALSRVPHAVHISRHRNVTSARCEWHVPHSHWLESWGDARAYDGTVSLMQPLIEPFYSARSYPEVLAALQGAADPDGREILESYWRGRLGDRFGSAWKEALFLGLIPGTAFPPEDGSLRGDWQAGWMAARDAASALAAGAGPEGGEDRRGALEIEFRPDPMIWDGSFAFNVWLQETPKHLCKLTWDNAAYLAPGTAAKLGLESRDVVELLFRGRSLRAPVWVQPGQCDGVVTVTLGYGRAWPGARHWAGEGGGQGEEAAEVDPGSAREDVYGYNAYAIRTSEAPWFGKGLELRKTGETYPLACAQDEFRLMGRPIVRAADYNRLLEDPHLPSHGHQGPHPSLYPEFAYESYAWGMAVDMTVCTGCSACVVACRAENNVPVVGKEGMLRGRDMNWLRIDRYFSGDVDRPMAYFQPMLCQHCEKAPCEVVCPVEATLHSGEGLNEMIYNRCIGTRYCSNNCPYKVRRFNFFGYVNARAETLRMARNPDVTVRARGVMEKCTFCVQRIAHARIEAGKENRRIRDGEAMTACMQACPTGAMVFGDLNDPAARVSALHKLPWGYQVLGDLNTRPRIRYLARIWNLDPDSGGAASVLPT
jgi:molybdopterin-containing oxidoreductase family iron-sulfur binding subunit